ncbi:glycosyltransferase family 4 protein [Vannielia litorea]|uniref:Glycosyltransferase involved in cell wall bisynthesis n=1 Tax=Vannielia litorea TaxID=1217970 RepID=A0A1N6E319_9RHOB|nr:glycosyltransferase family 4 protein [Vannielia litorea]SIN77445.1 Glycosyltransferase involved in cell wall bisynthesis [Vannielia litorea]
MTRLRVLHLVDDTTAGGVMRVIDHLLTAPELAAQADHELRTVARGGIGPGRLKADVIVSHLAVSWRALPMLALLRLCNPRARLIHVEHSYTEAFVAECVPRKGRFTRLLRTAYRLFDTVVAVSAAQGAWLARIGAVRTGALRVIRSTVDTAPFRALPRPAGPVRVFGAIGRLDRQKGFDTLIAAFRQVEREDIALHIYGEGPEKAALEALAGADPRIRFMGFAANPAEAFAAVDCVAMPSRWEAYGLVALEALAAGRSLLVNPVDGLQDHVATGAVAARAPSAEAWAALITCTAESREARPDAPMPTSLPLWQALIAGTDTQAGQGAGEPSAGPRAA